MNRKGQALVEFVIILPILLILILGIMDIGKILYFKISLEDQISTAIDLYQKGNSNEEILTKLDLNNTKIDVDVKREVTELTLTKEIAIITPGLNLVFNNPYELQVKRSILNE